MTCKKAIGVIVAMVFVGCIHSAAAQTTYRYECAYPWCVNYVQVVPNASGAPVAAIFWNEIYMQKKLTGATVLWELVGSPDYEFRGDSIVITGTNAPGSATVFPVRQITDTRYALDDLNTNDLSYTYEVRVYKKGSPAGTAPAAVGTGAATVRNVYN